MNAQARLLFFALGSWVAAGGCAADPAPPPPSDPVAAASAPVVEAAPVAPPAIEAPPKPSPLALLRQEAQLRLELVELAHLATRSRDGVIAIDLGAVSARKHINGGWRTGWRPEPRRDEAQTWFEVDGRAARVFFKTPKEALDRVVVRMRAPVKSNKVTFYMNDQALETVSIDNTFQDYTVAIPEKARRDGENHLLMRFTSAPKVQGRTQAAWVDRVTVLPPGRGVEEAPGGDAVLQVALPGGARRALVAATPQTFTHRLYVSPSQPRLGLAWAALAPGAQLSITAESDLAPRQTLLEVTAGEGTTNTWQEAVLDLGAFAGHVIELNLSAGGAFPEGQLVAFGELALYDAPAARPEPAAAPDAPARNVLIYLIDTMRHDKFDAWNPSNDIETPHIDAFAKDATVFEYAYDNENWTKPSTATIWTSLYPETHKAKEDSSKLPEDVTTFSEHLHKNGFTTGSFIANGYVSDAFGFKQGWDYYTNYIREEKRTDADRVVDDALVWIDRNKDRRFFAYLHTIDPHVPYSPPPEYRKKYWDKKYGGWIKGQNTGDQLAEIKTGKRTVNDEDRAYLEALYNGEVTFNDHEFGRLVAALKERGLYDDTLIVIVADHGEEFWDHGSVGHGHSLYDEMIHTPYILRYPKGAPRGARVHDVVAMVDLAPTLLDLLGVGALEDQEGVSHSSLLRGAPEPRPYLAVTDFLWRTKAFRAGRYSWITGGYDGDLFDVVADRRQKKDVLRKHAIGRAYVRELAGQFLGAPDKTTWWQDTHRADRIKTFAADAVDTSLDPELRQQLEAMGYVEGTKVEGEKPPADKPPADKPPADKPKQP